MDKLKMKSFVVEYRSRIKAGNCFIYFNNKLDQHQTKVLLRASGIVIQIDDDVYKIETKNFFNINIKSFHSLLVKDAYISFRFIVDEDKFDSEVLLVNGSESKFQRIKLNVESNKDGVDMAITCSNCSSLITSQKEVTLKRILELPSSNLDVSDWFCHRHGDEKIFNDGENKEESSSGCFDEKTHQFQPKTHDLFYGPFCLLMNSQLMDMTRLRQKRQLIYCKRCLQPMGEHRDTITKFWCDSVKFNGRPFFDVDSPITLIRNVIKNHLACDGLMYLAPIVKIIFESAKPTDEHKVNVLIQVMEKNLQLLRLNLEDSKLTEQRSIKVMYLKLNHADADDERTLNYWRKDINVVTFELSFKMFHSLCEYLKTQSELIPEVYRSNNSFQFSYIEYL